MILFFCSMFRQNLYNSLTFAPLAQYLLPVTAHTIILATCVRVHVCVF